MTKRWHIGFFTNTYRPTMSGVVRSIDTFRESMTNMGHNVYIFAQHAQNYKDSEPFIFRYPAIEIPFANNYAFPLPVSYSISEIMPSLKMDVLHSHHPFLLGDTAANKAEELNLPLVFTFHTRYDEYLHYLPFGEDLSGRLAEVWIDRYLEKCQHIVAPSESIKQILIESGVIGDVTAVPTGINLPLFQNADGERIRREKRWGDDIVLISVGRLAKEKNFETLIAAAAQVIKRHDNVRLVILGAGMEKKNLEEFTANQGVADRVEFTGNVPYEEVPNYLKAADIFCFASITETQGLVTLEAMAADLPIVAVDATGTSDAVENGKDGLLTKNDSSDLADAIERVVVDEALRKQLQECALEKVKWFDTANQTKRMLDVYAQATEAKKANRYIQVKRKK